MFNYKKKLGQCSFFTNLEPFPDPNVFMLFFTASPEGPADKILVYVSKS